MGEKICLDPKLYKLIKIVYEFRITRYSAKMPILIIRAFVINIQIALEINSFGLMVQYVYVFDFDLQHCAARSLTITLRRARLGSNSKYYVTIKN